MQEVLNYYTLSALIVTPALFIMGIVLKELFYVVLSMVVFLLYAFLIINMTMPA